MKTKFISLIILVTVVSQLYGGSIWAKRNSNLRQPYTDEVARKVGDILTIQIDENPIIKNQVDTKMSNTNNNSASFDGNLGIKTDGHNLLPRMPGLDLTTTSTRDLTGNATFNDTRDIADEIAVVVEDVLPNGNLVVVGSRFREVAGDVQEIRVNGIIRPTDISFENTISSTKVADFQMVFTNRGPSSTYNKTGWLTNIFDMVWPF
ncbi:MAG: flagellar basal body L-ring protein FlgH [Phycisphaerae bacterium]|nr:flagellar basal body L-ring protein FlgH [Phycisphaerae bacterium]